MYLLFDIGGTKMRIAVSQSGDDIDKQELVQTPQDFDKAMEKFEAVTKQIASGKKILKVAGGVAGPFDGGKTAIVNSPHLPGWNDKPLKKRLEEVTESSVYLENDTALSGLGEATRGAGRDYSVVVYMTVSTGVGGARIVDKKIDTNIWGFEPGHQTIDADGTIFPELTSFEGGKNYGHLDSYIGGAGIQKRLGKKPSEVKDKKVWEELERLLAFGLNNTIVHWSPEAVILGGGLIREGGFSIDRVKSHLKNTLLIFPEIPEIKKAELGDLGGLYGALALLKQIGR